MHNFAQIDHYSEEMITLNNIDTNKKRCKKSRHTPEPNVILRINRQWKNKKK